MGEAWRIVRAKHAPTAFTGQGAAKTGGRWNSRGVLVVYTSGTKSLATLENLVHLNPPLAFKCVALPVQFDEALVECFPLKKLPADWRLAPPPPATKAIGDAWVQASRSAVLALPSVITGETNYLLNPAHVDFKRIKIGKPEPFTFDPRLLA
jgi:RES domain-containing protein